MKKALSTLYAVLMSVVVLTLFFCVSPHVVEYPKVALVIFVLLLLSPIGAKLREAVELFILSPMSKIAKDDIKALSFCPFIFGGGMLVAVAIPWLDGVEDWSVWNWLASMAFTAFNFETFYAFYLATRLASKKDFDEITNYPL